MRDREKLKKLGEKVKEARKELDKVIVGQAEVKKIVFTGIFAGGHVIIIGVPGLAKTLLVNTLSSILGLKFSRIQFTPDLMPGDITGTDIIEEDPETGKRHFRFVKGPVFANLVLADEINRAPPKTQSALLEAMQEYRVTYAGKTFKLDLPFFVMATQNPIELEGTYPLPEAQIDRFMFSINITYPSYEEEIEVVERTTGERIPQVKKVMSKKEILDFQRLIRRIPVSKEVIEYAVKLVNESRPERTKFDMVKKYVRWGASPRASQYLILGAKTLAGLSGRPTPSLTDVRSIAHYVLDHRIIVNFLGEAEGIKPENIVDFLLENVH